MSGTVSKVTTVQSDDRVVNQQAGYNKKAIDQISSSPLNSGTILTSVSLRSGTNTVSTKLSQTLRGWFIIRQRAAATVYDEQDGNTTPGTLKLNASADVVVDLFVF